MVFLFHQDSLGAMLHIAAQYLQLKQWKGTDKERKFLTANVYI
jgi:hypothetical protein